MRRYLAASGAAVTTLRQQSRHVLLIALLSGCVDPSGEQPWALNESRTYVASPSQLPAKRADHFHVVVPLGIDRSKITLAARDALTIGRGAKVVHVRDGRTAPKSGLVGTTGTLRIDDDAEVGPVYSLGPAPVQLGSGVRVHGYVKAAGLVTNHGPVQIDVGVLTHAPSSVEQFEWQLRFPTAAADAVVAHASDAPPQNLAAGAYRSLLIEPGALAVLRSGHYHFETLRIQPGAYLEVDNTAGPVFIWVRDQLELLGPILPDLLGSNLFLGYAGEHPPTIAINVRATIVAPFAELRLPATPVAHRGTFFGKSITLEAGAVVEHDAFSTKVPRNRAPKEVCSYCARAAILSAHECCEAFARATARLREDTGEACQNECTANRREPADACRLVCIEAQRNAAQQSRATLDRCIQVGPLTSYGQCQLHHGYRPGACDSLGFAPPTLGSCNDPATPEGVARADL